MSTSVKVILSEIESLCIAVLSNVGYGDAHADAIAKMLYTCQLDDCQSHGLFRLLMCTQTIQAGKIDGQVLPTLKHSDNAMVHADAHGGMSLLAVDRAIPKLIKKTRKTGIAALAVNRCFHFSALWPEVERLSGAGLGSHGNGAQPFLGGTSRRHTR